MLTVFQIWLISYPIIESSEGVIISAPLQEIKENHKQLFELCQKQSTEIEELKTTMESLKEEAEKAKQERKEFNQKLSSFEKFGSDLSFIRDSKN